MKKLAFLIGVIVIIQIDASAQSITNVSPNMSYRDTTLDVVIFGQSTHFGQGTSVLNQSVWFSQATNISANIIFPNSVSSSSVTMMVANFTIPASANVGYYNVNHANMIDGHIMLANGYRLDYNVLDNVTEFDEKFDLKIYPNPARDFLTIDLKISEKSNVTIELYDVQGKVIYKEYHENDFGNVRYNIDLNALSIRKHGVHIVGTHIIKIQVGDEFTAKTLIVE